MNTFRSTFKTTILVLSLVESLFRFACLRAQKRLLHHRAPTSTERAIWLHGCCRRILCRLHLPIASNLPLPSRGLVVSNHLSHLDILLYGSLGPVIFIAKEEVRGWPLLGKLAENGGTVFVDRQSPAQAALAAKQIEDYLREDIPVLLFPEGTSSDGRSVLPFRSSLFEPAMHAGANITPSAIGYSAEDADESELTYWGNKVFFPNLYATLGRRNLTASIFFHEEERCSDRKAAARVTHAQVSALRARMVHNTSALQETRAAIRWRSNPS